MQRHRKNVLPQGESCHSANDHEDQTLTVKLSKQSLLPQQSLDAATPVYTPKGVERIDALTVGQRVLTRSGAFEQITQIDHHRLTNRQLHDMPDAAPIRFDPGALPGMPDGPAILVSSDCPIAWAEGPQGTDHFPARAFCDGGLIRWVIPEDGIHYIRLHFEQSQQLCIGGLWVELTRESETRSGVNALAPTLVRDSRVFRPLRD